MNAIFLRRCRKVLVPPGTGHSPLNVVATLQKNLEALGFALSQPLLAQLQHLSLRQLTDFSMWLTADLRQLVGAHRRYQPFYPNFPDQVMQLSEAELYLNALFHYLTHLRPDMAPVPRPPLVGTSELRVIEAGTPAEFEAIFTRLAAARSSLSDADKDDLRWFVRHYRDDIARLLPAAVPFKENLAVLGAALLADTTVAVRYLSGQLKTATDVLRLAVALSNGNVSLAQPARFKRFPRPLRRQLLAWIDALPAPAEDFKRWPEPWKRLGERLHPGEFAERFPTAFVAFQVIRNREPFLGFNGQVETALRERRHAAALSLLARRPGDLTRRLDHLLRTAAEPALVLETLRSGADRVSTPVLLQTLCHFEHRPSPETLRTVFPKASVAKVQRIPQALPPLEPDVQAAAIALCRETLRKRFSTLPPLGRSYVDPALAGYLVPFSQRSASRALRTLVRGSRLPLPERRIVRFFLWWKNGRSRTDIDLSAVLYDNDYRYVDDLSYYNLASYGGCHSGDIVDAPQGAAEFIDLDLPLLRERGIRFVVMSIHSFSGQAYVQLPECFAGWMARSHAASGEIFEPRTVHDRIDLAADTTIAIPLILDLAQDCILWTDIALKKNPWWNNVANNLTGISLILRAMSNLHRPDLKTLFDLHAQARGTVAATPEEADTVFSVQAGITPFDLDRIRAEFM